MKKTFALLVGVVLACLLQAQTADTITNKAILKMTKAKLADELIIDVIQSSVVNFDLSADAIINLKNANVTDPVIEAMKKASGPTKTPVADNESIPEKEIPQNIIEPAVVTAAEVAVSTPVIEETKATPQEVVKQTPVPAETQNKPQPLNPKTKTQSEAVEPAVTVEALKYSTPLKNLVSFHEKEFQEMTNYIIQWDKQILDSIAEINRINAEMLQLEYELREKKNADATKYSDEILALIRKQNSYRERYKLAKNNLVIVGEAIAKKLDDISKEKVKALSSKYGETRQQVKSSDANPAKASTAVPITFPKLRVITNTSKYLLPVTEMLVWHQNNINEILVVVKKYNARVIEVNAKDAEQIKLLEPVNSKLDEYSLKPKVYKSEISALKKQKSAIEKQRKTLAAQMESDSNDLADYLKQSLSKNQYSSKERFEDIIKNINYLFKEQLTF